MVSRNCGGSTPGAELGVAKTSSRLGPFEDFIENDVRAHLFLHERDFDSMVSDPAIKGGILDTTSTESAIVPCALALRLDR